MIPTLPTYPGLNLTECEGALGDMTLPGALVRPFIPSAYTLGYPADAVARLFIEMSNCAKVAVEGRDRGSASIMFMFVDVRAPPDSPPGPDFVPRFVLEARTNNSAILEWLRKANLTPSNGSFSRHWAPIGPSTSKLQATLSVDGEIFYDVHGLTTTSQQSRVDRTRFYYGPDGKVDFLNQRWAQRWTGSYDGYVTMHPESLLSRLLGGATSAHIGTSVIDSPTRVLARFDSPVE